MPIRDEARAEARATRAGAARPAEVRRAAGGVARGGACAARDIAVGDMRATRAVSRWRLVACRRARISLRRTAQPIDASSDGFCPEFVVCGGKNLVRPIIKTPTYHKNETVCRVRQTKFDTSAASARSNEPEIDPENDHPLEFVKTSASSTPPLTTARDRTTVPSRLPRKRIMGCCGPKECVEGTSDAFSFPSHASRARSPGHAVSASPSKSGNNGNRASSRRARRGVRRDTFFGSRRSRRNGRSR